MLANICTYQHFLHLCYLYSTMFLHSSLNANHGHSSAKNYIESLPKNGWNLAFGGFYCPRAPEGEVLHAMIDVCTAIVSSKHLHLTRMRTSFFKENIQSHHRWYICIYFSLPSFPLGTGREGLQSASSSEPLRDQTQSWCLEQKGEWCYSLSSSMLILQPLFGVFSMT